LLVINSHLGKDAAYVCLTPEVRNKKKTRQKAKPANGITADAAVDCRGAIWQWTTKLHCVDVDKVHAKQAVVDEHLSSTADK